VAASTAAAGPARAARRPPSIQVIHKIVGMWVDIELEE